MKKIQNYFHFIQKNGLIKSFTKFSKKNTKSFMILDEIDFTWKSKQLGGLGYVNIDLKNQIILNLIIYIH